MPCQECTVYCPRMSLDHPHLKDEDPGLRRQVCPKLTQAGGAGPAVRPQSLDLKPIKVSPQCCALCMEAPVSEGS